MPIALVVEDGSLISGANSYVSVADYRTYCANRKIDIAADATDADAAAAHLIQAFDYIELMRGQFVGVVVSYLQKTAWPREYIVPDSGGAYTQGVPPQVIAAQCELAAVMASGIDVLPTLNQPGIKQEVVGPLSTTYSESEGATGGMPVLTKVRRLLSPLLRTRGVLSTYRA